MSYVCESCGHRKWGVPQGAGAGRRVCFACLYGDDACRPRPASHPPGLPPALTWTYRLTF